ncbi:ABC transporter C family member 10 [Cryptomeria japonica]|uniref:ABC transporter C family member 10 n=1 Tax=Cryptomeria japonica TaxID=3369 RepID=UPI0027DA2684|nr:ABC transporter C family member 10 [Cryptomeria japonica]
MVMNFTDLWINFCGESNSLPYNADCGETCRLPLSFNTQLLHTFRLPSCSKNVLISITHLVFLLTFGTVLLLKWSRQTMLRTERSRTQFQTSIVTINVILGIVNLGLGVEIVYKKIWDGTSITALHNLLVLLVQGLAWLMLALSVTLRCTHAVTTFLRIWWVITFLLETLDFISVGFSFISSRESSTQLFLALVSWLASCLLLICAAKEDLANSGGSLLSEPILNGDKQNRSLSSEQAQEDPLLRSSNPEVTPFAKAGIFGRMTFWWLNSLLSKGRKRPLEENDLPQVCEEDQAENCYLKFTEELARQKQKNPSANSSVFWALARCHWKNLARTGISAFLKIATLSCGPLVLNAFIGFSEDKQSFKYQGYALVGALFLAKLLESLSQRQWYFGTRRIGLQMRSALITAIYEKQLKLSNEAKQVHGAGEIMNYMSVDAYRIGEFPFWLHLTWTTVLQLVFALSILSQAIGWATVAALAVVILTMICNSPLAKLQHKFQTELMSAQDERLRAVTEALVHMKVLKLHAWEEHFKYGIEKLRNIEYKWLSAVQFRKAYNSILFWSSPILVSTATFATCYFLKIPLTPRNVFTFIATLRLVQEPIRVIPDVIAVIIPANVSLGRVINFLESDELQDRAVECGTQQCSEHSIFIKSATLSWDTNSSKPTLRNIDIEVEHGQKVAVCGEVGSGKSTLLAAILGEVPKLRGNLQVCGTLAYVSQTAWIQSGTVRDNILFGSAMYKQKYKEVIQKASLEKDLENLPFGDLTEIGERGVNLSGGQKQRIQLARALYQDADIYLLDDPFSAVDAHTATSLFKDYIMEALSKKIVILVTHQVDFLPAFDTILLMSDGEVEISGSYQDLLASSEAFQELVNAHKDTMGSNKSSVTMPPSKDKPVNQEREIQKVKFRKGQEKSFRVPKVDQLVQKEEKEIGDTGLKPYVDYLKQNRGFLYCSIAGLSHLVFLTGQILGNTWMAAKVQSPQVSTLMLIIVYSSIAFASSLFLFLRSIFVVILGLETSKSFFSALMTSLFQAPMAFFDATPLGRILSRVSSDLSILDIDLPFSFVFTMSSTMNAYSNLGVVAVVTWQVLFAALPVIYLTFHLQKYYFASAKELMRLNGTTKSPIANHFGESISGAVTIRAFKVQDQFMKKNLDLLDKNSSPFFYSFAANEWLIQRLEVLSSVVLCSSALAMVLLPAGTFNPGFVGMALSYGLSMNISLVFSIQNQCTLANYIVSVERIKQYMCIPSEAPAIIESSRPPENWPSHGKVELQDLKIRYRSNSPLVLRGITCTFEGGEKIGIVGRTGSGKTTLISAIFRLVEPAGGRILIDGLDTTSIGLHDLRSHLGIIPQEPTLFRGTVRFNLDPLSEHSDSEIWKVLDKCQLGDVIREKESCLGAPVEDDGGNWSVGQRQLFCLGRALLRQSRILVLDEATASIDNATDSILQTTIREEFAECTVITVAHRIPTVMDSDMVVVIIDGEMVECEKPLKLMEREGSLFGKLVTEYWAHTSEAFHHAAAGR